MRDHPSKMFHSTAIMVTILGVPILRILMEFEVILVFFFLILHENICYDLSLELPHCSFNLGSQHTDKQSTLDISKFKFIFDY